MAPVGRPRVTTRTTGARPPVSEIGVAEPLNYGVGLDPYKGGLAPWRMWMDTQEYVPDLRWPRSVKTFNEMRTDSQLAALVTAVMYGITQLRFLIDDNGARPSLVKEVAEDLNLQIKGKDDEPTGRIKRRFSHHKFATQAMLAVVGGHMYFEQVGEIVDGKWRLRKMAPRMPHTLQQINVADDGGLVSIKQWMGNGLQGSIPGTQPEIPVDHLTAFIFQQEGYSWVGRSMMRDCYKDWLIKDRLMRVEAINHERAGGVPYANAPQGATVTEIEDLDAMMRQFRIGETAGGALPFGAELHIAKGSGSDIDKTIQRYNESMARKFMMMVANLAQGGQHVGSYALGDIFNDLWHIGQRAIAQWYCDTVNEHIIEDIADWNYGEDEELVPKLVWERTREDSLGIEQLALLVQRGVIIVDEEVENAVRYKYQLPRRTKPRPAELMGPGLPRTQPPEAPPPAETKASQAPPSQVQVGAPSSGDGGLTLASIWSRKPDVMAASAPSICTVPNVEILHAGIEYNLSTGPTTFTPEDLQAVVTAANEDPSIPNPRLKIGHIDPRFDGPEFDGTSAFGKASNLRLSDNGMAVYADYVGVPRWLAEIMPYAFPSRSIEGYWNVESQMGKKWSFVLSACSLLGVKWPGVTVLEDLPQYYGDDIPEGVEIDESIIEAVAASKQLGGDPTVKFPFKKTEASANLDDVRRAFYNEYIDEHKTEGTLWWWIQAVLTDPNELIVEDDEDGQLYKIPFSSDTSGAVSFGEPETVRVDYVPDDRESMKAAAVHVAATLAIGRKVLATWPTRAESRPATASGGAMDPKEIRKRLNLPEDASDEQVQETLTALNEAAGVKPVVEVPKPEAATPEVETETEEPEAAVPAAVAASVPKGFVLIDETTLETLKVGASAGLEVATNFRKAELGNLVSAAIKEGKIAPAARQDWITMLESTPSAKETLAAMKPGLIPVEMREIGHGGGGAEGGAEGGSELNPEAVASMTDSLFPEVRNMRARDRALASGEVVHRSRIAADASYRR